MRAQATQISTVTWWTRRFLCLGHRAGINQTTLSTCAWLLRRVAMAIWRMNNWQIAPTICWRQLSSKIPSHQVAPRLQCPTKSSFARYLRRRVDCPSGRPRRLLSLSYRTALQTSEPWAIRQEVRPRPPQATIRCRSWAKRPRACSISSESGC